MLISQFKASRSLLRITRRWMSTKEPLEESLGAEDLLKFKPISKEMLILSSIPSYKEGIRYFVEKEYADAEQAFHETIKILENDEEKFDPKVFSLVLQRLAMSLKIQNKESELTEILEKIYFSNVSDDSANAEELYKSFSNLATHYAIHDVDRGIVFCETALEGNDIPQIFVKDAYLHLGTLHLLKGKDYATGNEFLKKSVELNPHPITRGSALQNLACGTWWNYLQKLQQEAEKRDEEEQIAGIGVKELQKELIEDYNQILPLFKRAIKSYEILLAEDIEKYPKNENERLNPKQLIVTDNLLDEKVDETRIKEDQINSVFLKNPLSAITAMNISEFCFRKADFQSAYVWVRCSLKCAVTTQSSSRTLRSMVILALLSEREERFDIAEKLYLDCLEYMEGLNTFNKVFCLDNYSMFLLRRGRKYEAKYYAEQSRWLFLQLKPWDERKELLTIPDYQM